LHDSDDPYEMRCIQVFNSNSNHHCHSMWWFTPTWS